MSAAAPQAEVEAAGAEREPLEQVGVAAVAVVVEVGCRRPDADEVDVDVQAVACADDVSKETVVLVDAVGRRLRRQVD